jgi:ADP-L-glycero-D-manno-heptose 6-epimerase
MVDLGRSHRSDSAQDWAGTRALVTGGAGFIGSALVWELNRRGCRDVVIADSSPQAARECYLRGLHFSAYVDPFEALARLTSGSPGASPRDSNGASLGKFDFVFHLGACSSTLETDVDFLRRNNFEYSRDLAEWAISAGTRFIYASSAATYGDGRAGMDDGDPRSIQRLQPLNLYAQSKQQMDLHAWRQGWLDQVVALKYFNVYGPNEEHKGPMQSVARKGFTQVMETGRLPLFKSYRPEYAHGEQLRDFLYVKDAVAMTLHLAAKPTAAGIFNIGSGAARSWNDMGRALFSALGREPRIEYVEMPEAIRDKYQYFTRADIAKLRSTGYADAITPLEEGVRDYVTQYLVPGRFLGEDMA